LIDPRENVEEVIGRRRDSTKTYQIRFVHRERSSWEKMEAK